VTHHGGFVTVESEPGKGSAFAVHLRAAEATRPEEAARRSDRLAVLLVDDEEQILRTTGRLLTALGYQVLRARSGREAIDLYRDRGAEIAVVILDLVMPGLSGRETFEALRQIQPALRILLSSGYSLDGQAAELLQSPGTVFIQKPYSLDSLSQGLQKLLTGP
jgi:CheY-like chemotaxis protein